MMAALATPKSTTFSSRRHLHASHLHGDNSPLWRAVRTPTVLATAAKSDSGSDSSDVGSAGDGHDSVKPSFFVSMVSGAAAGVAVDVSLFPIDTIKTRMQTKEGFFKAGGFRGIYNGLGVAALGSAPGAAAFFTVYDTTKRVLEGLDTDKEYLPLVHMTAASIAEVFACLVRVPTENVKQKQQAGIYKTFGESVRGIRGTGGLGTLCVRIFLSEPQQTQYQQCAFDVPAPLAVCL